jgi:hypothetical protein
MGVVAMSEVREDETRFLPRATEGCGACGAETCSSCYPRSSCVARSERLLELQEHGNDGYNIRRTRPKVLSPVRGAHFGVGDIELFWKLLVDS